jgi:hypothetical protein
MLMQEDQEQLQRQADLLSVEILNKKKLLDSFRTMDAAEHAYHIKELEEEISELKLELDKLTEQGITPIDQLAD